MNESRCALTIDSRHTNEMVFVFFSLYQPENRQNDHKYLRASLIRNTKEIKKQQQQILNQIQLIFKFCESKIYFVFERVNK